MEAANKYNTIRLSPVEECRSSVQQPHNNPGINLRTIIRQIIHIFLANSTLVYNGDEQTIEYEYHGREKQFKLSTAPTIKKPETNKVREE